MALVLVGLLLASSVSALAATTPVEGAKYTYTGSDATSNGNIAIKNATKDVTYTLYKIFDATYDAADNTKVAYTASTAVKNVLTDTDYFTFLSTADSGKWTVTRTAAEAPATGTKKTDAELITYLKSIVTSNFTEIGAIKSTVDGKIEWDKIPYGYYIIVPDSPTENAVVTIDTNNPTVEVVDKNQTSTFEKYIVGENDTKVYVNEAGLAEDVPFKIEVNAINYDGEDKVFKYRITDTLENGWTLKAAPVVQVGTTTINALSENPANGAGYTLTYYDKDGAVTTTLTNAQKFVIDVRWTDDGTVNGTHLYASNEKISVTYTADLDATKIDSVDVGGTTAMQDGNRNTAKTEYFKDHTGGTPDSTEPSGTLGEQKTETFTTELTILKQDQDGNALEGAEFTLVGPNGSVVVTTKRDFTACESTDADAKYWKLKDGTYTTDDPNTEGMNTSLYESTTQMYKETVTSQIQGAGQTNTEIKMTVGKDGKVTFTGLRDGAYTLKETKVPDGYNGIENIDFTITCTITKSQSSDQWTVAYSTNNQNITVENDNKLKISITNNKGVELPSTGGIGTTIFYVAGSILVLAAAILLITKRRMGAGD